MNKPAPPLTPADRLEAWLEQESLVTAAMESGMGCGAGRQLATAEARRLGPDGTLYAHGTTTCLVFERAPPENLTNRA